jgi:hypothetical protein
MARLVRHAVPVGVLMLLALAGCGADEPTAAEAGEALKTHITKLAEEANIRDVRVTDPGGKDIFCGNGRAKRTYAISGRDVAPERTPNTLKSGLLGTLKLVAKYELTNPEEPIDKPWRAVDDEAKTMLVLDSPGNGRYAVSGETQCLPTS